MRASVLSAGVWGVAGVRREAEVESISQEESVIQSSNGWSPRRFEQEQIRGLVRQVFSPRVSPLVRQLVFTAAEPETDVLAICERVGETLATETPGNVVVVAAQSQMVQGWGVAGPPHPPDRAKEHRGARESATRVRRNLWLASGQEAAGERFSAASLHAYLAEVRREFEYSIVAAPPAGESNEALAMAQFADGIILVLSAMHTRRVTARKIAEVLAQVRLLGTVLADREFPMPEGIYRRL